MAKSRKHALTPLMIDHGSLSPQKFSRGSIEATDPPLPVFVERGDGALEGRLSHNTNMADTVSQ